MSGGVRWKGRLGVLAALLTTAVCSPDPGSAQVTWRDLVVTVGGSVEGYAGNFSAVTLPIVDSTDHVTATVGELGVRGTLDLLERRGRLELSFDGGMRQTAAFGFKFRDYAPREWVGSAALQYQEQLRSWGVLQFRGSARGRTVHDRPPPPLSLMQPAYAITQGSATFATRSFDGVSLDATGDVENADYHAPALLPQLDLLDRTSWGVEAGIRWGNTSTVRFSTGVRWTDYTNQPSYDPSDPIRRDRTVRAGLEWTYYGSVLAQTGIEGTLNRSNSIRPEYDAISFRLLVTAPLPGHFSASLYGLLARKSYVATLSTARVVPGEEADNASVAYLQLNRPVALDLDGAIRFGWTRAETDIGNTYYRRFGMSVLLFYRPLGG